MQTRAIVADGAGGLDRRGVELPTPARDGAVVRVALGGICGSDLHYWQHGRVGASVITEPLVLGHEIVGVVERAAADGTGPAAGTPVFVHPASTCGHCADCRSGRSNLCPELRYLGSAARVPHTAGGFADRLVVPAARLLPLTGLSLERGALIEPASIAWHAVDRAGRLLDLGRSRVAVLGSGPIGLLCVAVLRGRFPAIEIAATDLHQSALERARACGADQVLTAAEVGALGSVDAAFETSGTEAGLRSAITLTRPGGTVVAVGHLPDPVTAPLHLLVARELDLIGSSRFAAEAPDVIAALRTDRLPVEAVVSHRYPADDFAEAFAVAADPARSSKVLLEFGHQDDEG